MSLCTLQHNMDHDVNKSKLISIPNAAVNRQISTPDLPVSRRVCTPDSAVTRHSTGSINRSLLTPCRRIGLGRPSTASLKKSGMYRSPTITNENTPVTPKNVTHSTSSNRRLIISPLATRNCEDTLPHKKNEANGTPVASKINGHTAINCNVNKSNLTRRPGIKRCLSNISESKENKKLHIKEMETENDNTETMDSDCVDTENTVIDKGEADSRSEQTCLQESSDKKQKLDVTNRTLAEIAERIIKKKKRLEDLKIQEIYAKKVITIIMYLYCYFYSIVLISYKLLFLLA